MKKQIIEQLDVSQPSQESLMAMMLSLSFQGVSYIEKWAAGVVASPCNVSSEVPVAAMTRQRAGQLSEICSGLMANASLDEFLIQLADKLRDAELRHDKASTRLFNVTVSADYVMVTCHDR